MADFRFTEGDYRKLCPAIQANDIARFQSIVHAVSDEDRSRFGPTTFCPPPSTKLPSPLVTAAWSSSVLGCKHLVRVFPNAIDINANGLVYNESLKVCTALVAACTARGGKTNKKPNIDLIKYLVENGANVNQATLDGKTPIMAAVPLNSSKERIRKENLQEKCWKLFKYLVSEGADVSKTDRHGDNCLLNAICMYGTSVIKYLHSAGVNIDLEHRNAQGYTILHEACRRGMATEYIRNALQCVPLPLYAPSTDSTHPGYIPCPLYLAAAKGNEANLEELLKIENCPLEGVADAYLLCGTVKQYGKRTLSSKGVELLEKHSIQLSYPPPRPEYDYQVEIKTTEELDAVWGTEDCKSMVYQCALIMERCLGPNSLLFAELLLDLTIKLIGGKHYTEAERFWEKSINISMGSGYHPLHSSSGYCYNMTLLSKRIHQVVLFGVAVEHMLKDNYIPNFPCFVAYVLHISNRYILFSNILDLFRKWKVCNTHQSEFVNLFRSFIDGYAQLSTGSTVLHEILKQKQLPYEQTSDLPVEQLQRTFIEAVLEAGCDEFVNCVDDNGQRPLHILADNKSLVKLLIDHGAHVDAVDSQGKPALPIGTFGAPSLYCTVANAIVQYSLPYQSIGLPPHVVQFVMLHNPLYAVL